MIRVVNKHKHVPTSADFYVGRGNVLGNPFTSKPINNTKAEFQASSREESVASYRVWLKGKIASKDKYVCAELNRIYLLARAGDVNLVCFCKPQSCHGDVIKEVIESKL